MSIVCEISGESLLTLPPEEVIVATPSGHICRRRLLLTKLLENGGLDPFASDRPLREDDLIVLQLPTANSKNQASSVIPPPRNFANHTITSSIQQIQFEYDALVLELFDTRKLLEETRKELSLALYQNDAAIRVVARITAERDAALSSLQQWSATAATAPPPSIIDNDEPLTKKVKRSEETAEIAKNLIPEEDLQSMLQTWESLHQTRKVRQKRAMQNVVSVPQLQSYQRLPTKFEMEDRSSNVSLNQEKPIVTCLATCDGHIPRDAPNAKLVVLVGTHSRTIFIYRKAQEDESTGEPWKCVRAIPLTEDCPGVFSKVAAMNSNIWHGIVATLAPDGLVAQIQVYLDDSRVAQCSIPSNEIGDDVVDLRWHPNLRHFFVATRRGKIFIGLCEDQELSFIAQFVQDASPIRYSAAALHPDGLIYVAAVQSSGDLLLWDLKSQSLAGTLALPEHMKVGADYTVSSVEFSNNGYHLAVAYAAGILVVWDLRKQSILKILNDADDTQKLDRIASVQFDPSGKYLAYSGSIGNSDLVVAVTTVKEWARTMTFQVPNADVCSGLVWGETWIAVSAIQNTTSEPSTSKNNPTVVVFGLSTDSK